MGIEERLSAAETELEALQNTARQLKNFGRVIGILAFVFGIGAGWGWKVLTTAKEEIAGAQNQIAELQHQLGNLASERAKFTADINKVRVTQEEDFRTHVSQSQQSFDSHINQVVATAINQSAAVIDLQNNLAGIQKNMISFGSQVRIHNPVFNRCMDVDAGNNKNLQLIDCKNKTIPNQTWVLEKRE